MLRFAKGLDWASHPTIAQIYEDSPSVIALITERRLNHLGRTIKRRFTYPQPLLGVLEQLVGLYRPSPLGTGLSGFDYIEQFYNDLDNGLWALNRAPIQRNSWRAITDLVDNDSATGWDAVVAAAVATVPPPAPILNPALVQARKRSASARNLKKHDGRTPIRSLRKLRANCARLSSSPEQRTKPRKHQSTPLPLNSPSAGQHGGDHLGSPIGSPIASRGADILQATPQNTNK